MPFPMFYSLSIRFWLNDCRDRKTKKFPIRREIIIKRTEERLYGILETKEEGAWSEVEAAI
jgi:hypothetical protein